MFLETASSPICLDNPKSSGKSSYGEIPGAQIHRQKRSILKIMKKRRKWLKRRVPSLFYKLHISKKTPINANTVQGAFVKRSTCIITLRTYTRLISANSVQRSLVEENHYVNTSRLPMTGASPSVSLRIMFSDIWQKESLREAHSNLSPYKASRM